MAENFVILQPNMKPTRMLADDEAFFFEHAGYSTNQGETPEQGRTRGAQALASAERLFLKAYTLGNVDIVWEHDADGAQDAHADSATQGFDTCQLARLEMLDTVTGDITLASMGCILDADRAHRRVVRAELAIECAAKLLELSYPYPEVPNMDAMDEADLITWASENLQPLYHAETVAKLRHYAVSKAAATVHRLSGNIALAEPLEKLCQRIYDSLPQWARW